MTAQQLQERSPQDEVHTKGGSAGIGTNGEETGGQHRHERRAGKQDAHHLAHSDETTEETRVGRGGDKTQHQWLGRTSSLASSPTTAHDSGGMSDMRQGQDSYGTRRRKDATTMESRSSAASSTATSQDSGGMPDTRKGQHDQNLGGKMRLEGEDLPGRQARQVRGETRPLSNTRYRRTAQDLRNDTYPCREHHTTTTTGHGTQSMGLEIEDEYRPGRRRHSRYAEKEDRPQPPPIGEQNEEDDSQRKERKQNSDSDATRRKRYAWDIGGAEDTTRH